MYDALLLNHARQVSLRARDPASSLSDSALLPLANASLLVAALLLSNQPVKLSTHRASFDLSGIQVWGPFSLFHGQ